MSRERVFLFTIDNMKEIPQFNSHPKVYIIHENKEWILPLIHGLENRGTPYKEWFLDQGLLDINTTPPQGVFYNRMSASSHTRDHRYAIEMTAPVLAWLEAHGRKVINGRRAIQLEVRKIEQYISLNQWNIRTPETLMAVGKDEVLKAAIKLNSFPFILKPNRGGKGLDVRLFHTIDSLENYLEESDLGEISLDGVFLIQEYIKPRNDRIIRLEFIGGKFLYAVSIDASKGFELCPADSCQIEDSFCPADQSEEIEKFKILENFHIPEIAKCEQFLNANGIDIGGIEFVEGENGQRYFYDVNTNTNYNRKAEIRSGLQMYGMEEMAELLTLELNKFRSVSHKSYASYAQ